MLDESDHSCSRRVLNTQISLERVCPPSWASIRFRTEAGALFMNFKCQGKRICKQARCQILAIYQIEDPWYR